MKRDTYKLRRYTVSAILVVFAILTLFMSSSVLFDWFGIREKEGNYVPFIVIANFVSGFLYGAAAIGFIKSRKWTFWVLAGTSLFLCIAFLALWVHINRGGIYELKTLWAMGFRIVVTVVFTILSFYRIKNKT